MHDKKAVEAIPLLEIQKIVEEDHDTECAMKAGELLELGFMGQEFACYGVAYVEEKKIRYFVCDHEHTMQLFLQDCFEKNRLTTSVLYEVQRFQVPVGQHDFFKRKIRQQTAQKLKERYGKIYFHEMYAYNELQYSSDAAWPLLQLLCEELRNALNVHIVQIIDGLAKDAYEMRKLKKEHYYQICSWRNTESRNLAEEYSSGHRYSRVYHGFCSAKNGVLQYYNNASQFAVAQKRREKISKGEIVSPILHERYTTDDQIKLQSYRSDFTVLLKQYFTETFMKNLNALWQLPSDIDVLKYQESLSAIKQEGYADAIKDFLYYGYLWNAM